MAPPSSLRPRPVSQQLIALAKTQQFYWFLGHVLAFINFGIQAVLFIWPSASLKHYRFTLLSILITYVIVIKQIYFKRLSLSSVSLTRLARDENVHYFVLALTFYVASFKIGVIAGSLYLFIIFAVFHILTYFQNNLLAVLVPSIAAQQQINTQINNFTLKFNQQALVLAANAEVILAVLSGFQLIPAFLFQLLWSRQVVYFATKVVVFGVVLVFVKFRYDANPYTKAVVDQFDARINAFVFGLNDQRLVAVYTKLKQDALRFLAPIKVPKEEIKKN
ncbi:uncharacterized protein CANTADRAFT_51191 [Suhomyces tanzawaensis NRRL Y-17324]|uniref:Pore and endoplasmic reticulum protein of 33 kDa n=1 Tax=Suhomyces tanzawaensis NRRL Y-17324 TaxID=984487 RepID=A0A1E4SHY1_9ASCO|nr:uncharacterized protein CANTADRAFT_51191 [Suhomyces tanzawaensis NRRL Y-17324]ODV79106.1 hypothetical protein CANTADRAFT_51191 [Suhomyces tanzawaensis NRRL Y-17324]